jgi:acetoin:2,6-dichlorophenolindophenol oxidoreductase subunit alpha
VTGALSEPAPEPAELTVDVVLRMYRMMLLIRAFEECALDLYARAQIPGIAHVSIGQEAVSVGVCDVLAPTDYITSTHRGHGHCLAKGARPDRMLAEMLGRASGYCGGKGGSMHIADPATGNLGANAIVGGSLGIATGAALSAKTRHSGQIAVCFFGDGALNQGLLLEAMNMAAIWKLPCLYVCENNGYGEYTAAQDVTAGRIADRATALGINAQTVDGMDALAVREAAQRAAARSRSGAGPEFLVCETYRYFGHGMSDRDRRYRTRDEEREWRARDPIARLEAVLSERFRLAVKEMPIRNEVASEIEQAAYAAQNADAPSPDAVMTNVYAA